MDFLLNQKTHWHIGVDAAGQPVVEADGRPLILPRGNWDGGYLNYVGLSNDGRRLSTIDPYGDLNDARCHRVWGIGEEKARLIARPACYYSSEQPGMFSPDGTEFYAVARDGTLQVAYAGPERPDDWQWATVKNFVDLMGFTVREDGEIAAKMITSYSAAARLRELLEDEVRHGDFVARRVQDALATWCGYQHCKNGP